MHASYPAWALWFVYWLHMLATIFWVGSLACLSFIIYPAARQTLPAESYRPFMLKVQANLSRIGWLCLMILVVTGMFQMSANPNYQGFLEVSNPWAVAIFIKHIAIIGMVVLSIYLTWFYTPVIQRAAFQASHAESYTQQLDMLQKREKTLQWVNFGLAILILALTAWARIS